MPVFSGANRFRKRLVLLMLLSLVPASVVLMFVSNQLSVEAVERSREVARKYVRLVQLELTRDIGAMGDLLTAIILSPVATGRHEEECRTLLGRLARDHSRVFNLAIVRLDGSVACSVMPLQSGATNLSDRDYFQDALRSGELSSSRYIVGRITGEGVVVFARSVLDEYGRAVSVAFVATRFHGLSEVALHLGLGDGDLLLVFDDEGTIVGRFPDDEPWRGKSFSTHPMVQEFLRGGGGEGDFVALDGVPRRFAYADVDVSGRRAFHVAVGIDESRIQAQARKVFYVGLLAAVLVALSAMSILWFGAGRTLGRRLDDIVGAVDRLAAGEGSVRLKVSDSASAANDEFEVIARAFNALSGALQQREHDWRDALSSAETATQMTQSVLDSLSARIVVLDLDGRVLACNAGWGSNGGMLQPGADYLALVDRDAAFEPDVRRAMCEAVRGVLSHPGRACFEVGYQCQLPCSIVEYRCVEDGETKWYEMRVTPLRGGDGGVVVAYEDITERKQLSLQLEDTVARLRRSNRELQDFAYVASHDLQEPLRKVIAFAGRFETLYADRLDARGTDYLERMTGAASRMQQLIDDLLAMSRVNTRGQAMCPVDLGEIAGQVLDDLEERLRESGGTVKLGALPGLEADPTQMRQLLQNLVSNALKFVAPGQRPEVEIVAEEAPDGWVRFCVLDRGIGLPEEGAERIFSPFVRLHGRGEYGGTGLGLAVVQRIVDRHGGRISASARARGGACFRVELPAHQPGSPVVTPAG